LDLIPESARRAWDDALTTPIDTAPVWLHGDLHPMNVLSKNGRLSAVIDWGDICAGDAATDLACVWALLPDPAMRRAALSAYGGISDQTFVRARGWAIYFGVVHLDSGLINSPQHARIGETIMRRVAEDF
jgi:aminoglycoside phosphotransferase (APT) family kinase protein